MIQPLREAAGLAHAAGRASAHRRGAGRRQACRSRCGGGRRRAVGFRPQARRPAGGRRPGRAARASSSRPLCAAAARRGGGGAAPRTCRASPASPRRRCPDGLGGRRSACATGWRTACGRSAGRRVIAGADAPRLPNTSCIADAGHRQRDPADRARPRRRGREQPARPAPPARSAPSTCWRRWASPRARRLGHPRQPRLGDHRARHRPLPRRLWAHDGTGAIAPGGVRPPAQDRRSAAARPPRSMNS